MSELTNRELDVLRFINAYRADEQCNPTMAEIASRFGWASPNAAHGHILSMGRKGALRIREGKSRGYVIHPTHSEMA